MMTKRTDPMTEIAKRVREARLAAGLSQQELADQAGVSRPSVARVESGEDMSTATLAKITGALGLVLQLAEDGSFISTDERKE